MMGLLNLTLSILNCTCTVNYDISIGGLMVSDLEEKYTGEKYWPDDVIISRALGEQRFNLNAQQSFYYNNQRSVYTLVDYYSLKDMFYSYLCKSYCSVGRFYYKFNNNSDPNDKESCIFFLSVFQNKNNSFSLERNSDEVLIFLIGEIIARCIRGFNGSQQNILEELRQRSLTVIRGFRMQNFDNFFELLDKCAEFFENYKFDHNNPEDAFKKFIIFFMNNVLRRNINTNAYDLTRDVYVDALKCAGDFLNVCDCLRLENRSLNNDLKNYDYITNHLINVYKSLVIDFSYRTDLKYISNPIEILNDEGYEILNNEDIIVKHNDIICIKFDDLARHRIQSIRFIYEEKEIVIDVSKFTELAKKSVDTEQ